MGGGAPGDGALILTVTDCEVLFGDGPMENVVWFHFSHLGELGDHGSRENNAA